MEIKGRFDHFNINVTDLDRSLAFCDGSLRFIKFHMKDAIRCLPCSGRLLFVTVTDLGSHSFRLS